MSVSKKRSCFHTLKNEMKSPQWQSKDGKINESKRKRGAKAGPRGASCSASEGGERERESERGRAANLKSEQAVSETLHLLLHYSNYRNSTHLRRDEPLVDFVIVLVFDIISCLTPSRYKLNTDLSHFYRIQIWSL